MKAIVMLFSLFICQLAHANQWVTTQIPGSPSLRGSAVKDGVVWVSGANNAVFISRDQGRHWVNVSVKSESKTDFRDIEVFDQNTAIVMGVGSGTESKLYLTEDQGQTWTLLNENKDPTGFYDAIAFWDRNNGLMLGDPVDNYYVVNRTYDGGKTWQRVPKHKLPTMLNNEAAFAASGNTLIVGKNGNAWFTTGGFEASVYHSNTFGETWQRYRVPLHKVNETSGGYSMALNSQSQPFVLGGDYTDRAGNYVHTSYYVEEKGWLVPTITNNGLRTAMSCFAHTCISTGKLATDISYDHGESWQALPVSNQISGFYTLAQENGLFVGAGHEGNVGIYISE